MNLHDTLPYFELKGCDEKMHSLMDVSDKSCILVLFICNHCPYVQAYLDRIDEIIAQFYEDNLGVILINPNDAKRYPADSFEAMQELAAKYKWESIYWHDERQDVAKLFGATRTPEAFLFNSARELVYKGGIDDSWENPHLVTRIWLEDAIEYTLDGLEVDFPETQAVGCSIKWKEG
ncbi:MAG: thioredoxin family protein [Bacteroidota bacterium]|jgi:peroxiredoxin